MRHGLSLLRIDPQVFRGQGPSAAAIRGVVAALS